MKMILKRLIPGALLFSLLSSAALAQPKIATIDLRKVFDKYWKTLQANDMLQSQQADLEKTDKDLIAKFDKAKADYQKLVADSNDQAISTEEKEKRRSAAEDKFKEMNDDKDAIAQFERTATLTRNAQLQRTHDNILAEIRTVVSAKAKAGGFTLVVDVSDPIGSSPVVLYSNGDNDVTDAVLAQLNAGAPIDIPKPAGKTNGVPDDKKK